jgi:transcription antitermination factor NusG
LFVHTDIQSLGVSAVKWIFGAVGLVEFGREIVIIPDEFIAELRRRISVTESVGALHLDALKQGDPVNITAGPFAGYDAIIGYWMSGEERVQVPWHWYGVKCGLKLAQTLFINAVNTK